MGTLKPSVSEMSKKSSSLWPWPSLNSPSVFGDLPLTVQVSKPLQSPVWHDPPLPRSEQPVRAQMRPVEVPAGTFSAYVSPGSSFTPPPGRVAGHTV
uniref:Uncharacterized protein n=1 Tax=Triticum urartu TaxID=4572 RepID=A0A8R7PNV2_TRIUA